MLRIWLVSLVTLLFAPIVLGQTQLALPRFEAQVSPQVERLSEPGRRLLKLPIPEPVRVALRGDSDVLNEVNVFEPWGDDFENTWRSQHTYLGFLRHLSTHFAFDFDSELSPVYRNRRWRDGQGRMINHTYEMWDGGDYLPWIRSLFTYSGTAIAPTEVTYQVYDGAVWHPFQRENYTVSIDGTYYTAVQIDLWKDEWLPYLRFTLSNEGGGVTYTSEVWGDTGWSNDMRAIIPDITIEDLVAVLAQITEMEEDMIGYFLPMAILPDHTVYIWVGSAWVTYDRQTSTPHFHPQTGSLQRIETLLEEYVGGGWEAFGQFIKTYDLVEDDLLDMLELQEPDDGGWHTFVRETYSNSTSGRIESMVLSAAPDFFGQAGAGQEFEVLALFNYSWGEPAVSTDQTASPIALAIDAVFPNPLATTGIVQFQLAGSTDVSLELYDVLGRRVAVLVEEYMAAGLHEARIEVSSLAAGTYILRLQVADDSQSRAITVVR